MIRPIFQMGKWKLQEVKSLKSGVEGCWGKLGLIMENRKRESTSEPDTPPLPPPRLLLPSL